MPSRQATTIGLMGFGAFGALVAHHLHKHFRVFAYDPDRRAVRGPLPQTATLTDIATVARCDIVVLAVPISQFRSAVSSIRPHLRPGALVLDVGSIKAEPSRVMQAGLPEFVEIICTHPLFGPQSARHGIAGLKIAVCPIRGTRWLRVAAFLRHVLGLKVFVTTPDEHDRDMAVVQGLTHLIAKVLDGMRPLPTSMTTRSFDLLVQASEMVRFDPPELFVAIEAANPYASAVRERFFAMASEISHSLELAHGNGASLLDEGFEADIEAGDAKADLRSSLY